MTGLNQGSLSLNGSLPRLDEPLPPLDVELSSTTPLDEEDPVLASAELVLDPSLVDPGTVSPVDPEWVELVPDPSSALSSVLPHATMTPEGSTATAFTAFTTKVRRVHSMPTTVACFVLRVQLGPSR